MAIKPRYSTSPGVSSSNAQKLPELGTLARVAHEARIGRQLDDAAREATNAVNRQKTQTKNAYKAVLKSEGLTADDEIYVDGFAYKFDVAHHDVIPPDKLYAKIESGEITLEQFLKSVSVQKDEARRVCGAFITEALTEDEPGKTADIRKRELDPSDVIEGVKLVRAKPHETNVSPKVRTKPTIKQAPGKSLAPIRKLKAPGKW